MHHTIKNYINKIVQSMVLYCLIFEGVAEGLSHVNATLDVGVREGLISAEAVQKSAENGRGSSGR